jgi:hypothetical protein
MSDSNGKRRIDLLQPTEEEKLFSQADLHHVQRPAGVRGAFERSGADLPEGGIYSSPRVTPASWKEIYAFTVGAGSPQPFPVEEALGFIARTFLCDNYSNQWVFEENMKRAIPPYSFGWVLNMPSGGTKAFARLKVPSAAYVPAAAIAGEYAYMAWTDAFLPPMAGIIDRVKAPVVA